MSDQEKYNLNYDLSNAYRRNDKDEVQRLVDDFVDNEYSHNMRIYHGIEYEDEEDVVSLISDANTDFNWTNEAFFGWSFMHKAAACNKLKILDVMLRNGADSNIQDHLKQTPLYFCTTPQATQLLLDHGAHVEHTDDYGDTPLHEAVYYDREEVLHALIRYGSNLDTRNNRGETALDAAKRRNARKCVKILEDAMKKEDEVDDVSQSDIISQEEGKANNQDETIPDESNDTIKNEEDATPGIELFQCTQEERQKWEADKKDMVLKLQELSSLLDKERKRTQHLETDKKELLSQIEKEKKASQEILENNEMMKKQNQALETEKNDSLSLLEKQIKQLETEKQDLVCQLEQERKIVQEMAELMKQNQTPETESLSHLEKQRKQLKTDKKELLFQLEEKRKELQQVSVECHILKERNQNLETELNKQQKISVKSEMIEEQNQKLEDEKKALEKQMQRLQELSVKSEIIKDQYQKLEEEKKALQSQLEKQMQKLQEISDKCINAEAETRKVIIELEEGKKQIENEKNQLLTTLEEKQKEIQQLADQKSGLARQLEDEKVELLSQLEEQTMKSKQLSVENLCEVLEATAEVQRQWEELGIALGLDRTKLAEISQTHPSILQRHYHLMRFWITDVGASWVALVHALKSEVLKEEELAKKIEIDHEGQLSSVRVKVLVTQNDKKLTEANLADLQAISLVEWKAVGLMLGIHDGMLESIQQSDSSSEKCQHAMLQCWINTGQAYWSTLVEILRSPLLGEDEIADEITKRHLKVQTDEQFDLSKPEGSEPGTFPVSTEKLEKMKTKIKQRCSDKPNAQGIAFLIGFPDGNDVQDLSSTFENDLSFTVWSKREITCAKLACLVKAAVKVQYPPTYKYIVFYYAGHVGVNKSNRPFLVPVQPEANNEAEVLDINENILSPFNSKKNRPSCLFFFDCITPAEMSKVCESDDPCDSMKPVAPQEKILNLNAPVRCLVAYYATSVLQGEPIQRIWSQTLCKNLKEKYLSISRILDLTHDTIKDAGLTSPHYESFVGSVYLNGIPILPSEPVTSDSIIRHHRSDLCCILNIKENETTLFSLAGGLLARGIIDTTSKDDVCHKHKEADTLFSHVEKAVNKNPDMLDVVLEVMEKESCLGNIVRRMKDESDTAGKRIRMKRPERYEVHKLLISKSADWVEIARELRVDDNYRKQLRKYLQESSEEDVLEKVLARWIESETCEVTWKCIINVLKELKYITLLKMVQKHLRKEDVIKKYSKTPDFQFTVLDED